MANEKTVAVASTAPAKNASVRNTPVVKAASGHESDMYFATPAQMRAYKARTITRTVLLYLFLSLLGLFILVPFVFMIITSFRDPDAYDRDTALRVFNLIPSWWNSYFGQIQLYAFKLHDGLHLQECRWRVHQLRFVLPQHHLRLGHRNDLSRLSPRSLLLSLLLVANSKARTFSSRSCLPR
jgi:ABC-type glycerol-3-phosphate transport system permease component